MKNLSFLVGALALLAGVLPAQTATMNIYKTYDGTTDATVRPYGNREEGIYMCFRPELIRGLDTVDGWQVVCQDQNRTTQERVTLEIRRDDGEGQPGVNQTDVVWSANYTFNFGTGTNPIAAGQFTFTLQPIKLANPNETYWMGLHFPTTSSWPNTDGVSVHASCTLSTTKDCQEAPRGMDQFKGELCGYIDFTATTGGPGLWSNTALDMDISFAGPVVQGYAHNLGYNTQGGTMNFCTPGSNPGTPAIKPFANFGYAGVWPDIADNDNQQRWDGFGWEVRANSFAANGGFALLLLSDQTFDPGFINAGYGIIFLSPVTRFFNLIQLTAPLKIDTAASPPTAKADFGPFALGPANDPARFVFAAAVGPLHAQAVVVDAKNPTGNIQFTNLTTMNFPWGNKVNKKLDGTTKSVLVPVPVNARKVTVHSLRGDVEVQAELNSQPFGPLTKILSGCTKTHFAVPPQGQIKVQLPTGGTGALVDIAFE